MNEKAWTKVAAALREKKRETVYAAGEVDTCSNDYG